MRATRIERAARLAPGLVALAAWLAPLADVAAAPQRRAQVALAEHRGQVHPAARSAPRQMVRATLQVLRSLDRRQLRPRL